MTLKPKTTLLLIPLLVLFTCILFPSCLLDDTTPNPIIPHNYTSFESLFRDSALQIQLRTVDASQNMVFTTTNGTNVKLEANTLYFPNGGQMTDSAEIEFIELRSKRDLIFSELALEESNGTLLECVGGFYIEAKKNEETLNMDGILTIRFDDLSLLSGGTGDLSIFFTDGIGASWQASPTSSVSLESVAGGEIYELVTTKTGWLSACRPYVTNSNTTALTLISNRVGGSILDQKAFLLFDDFHGMASLEESDNNYTASGLPVGETAKVILMAFDENQFYLDIQNITIGDEDTLQMSMIGYTASDFIRELKLSIN